MYSPNDEQEMLCVYVCKSNGTINSSMCRKDICWLVKVCVCECMHAHVCMCVHLKVYVRGKEESV